jgi:hypothetical protein
MGILKPSENRPDAAAHVVQNWVEMMLGSQPAAQSPLSVAHLAQIAAFQARGQQGTPRGPSQVCTSYNTPRPLCRACLPPSVLACAWRVFNFVGAHQAVRNGLCWHEALPVRLLGRACASD